MQIVLPLYTKGEISGASEIFFFTIYNVVLS